MKWNCAGSAVAENFATVALFAIYEAANVPKDGDVCVPTVRSVDVTEAAPPFAFVETRSFAPKLPLIVELLAASETDCPLPS